MYIPYQQIASSLPIGRGDILLIASDISTLVYSAAKNTEKFDAGLFIKSLQEKLPEGTLIFPAFVNYNSGKMEFDIRNTPPETGQLSRTAFENKQFIRTSDPFHSFMAWGKHSAELAAIATESTFSNDSVFGFLHRHAAKMLLIDIDLQHSFTFAHYVEQQEKVNYRQMKKYTFGYTGPDGIRQKKKYSIFEKKKGIQLHLNGLMDLFHRAGAATEQRLNDSSFTLIDLEKCYNLICDDIRNNRASNLYRWSTPLYLKSTFRKMLIRSCF